MKKNRFDTEYNTWDTWNIKSSKFDLDLNTFENHLKFKKFQICQVKPKFVTQD